MTADLSAIIARLEVAEAGNRELDLVVVRAVGEDTSLLGWPPYTTSLDAALALAERVFPDGRWMVERTHQGTGWAMFQPGEFAKIRAMVDAPTPALALVIATLKAKMETE